MANKRITDVDFIDSLNSDESFFVNRNNTVRQISKQNIIIPVKNGGTGETTIEGIRNILGLGNTTGALSIENGGTNATTSVEALKNLGAQAKHTTATVTLIVSNWVDNTQTVDVENATETNTVLVGSFPDSYMEYAECGVRCTGQGDGYLIFVCEEIPSFDIQANVIFLE